MNIQAVAEHLLKNQNARFVYASGTPQAMWVGWSPLGPYVSRQWVEKGELRETHLSVNDLVATYALQDALDREAVTEGAKP